jgi:mannitol-specific phosphotransferase system IIBC component
VVLAPLLILSIASRYRLAGHIERQQLKWFLSAIAVVVGAGMAMFLAAIFTRGPIGETPLIVFALAALTVPLAIGIGILRHRLFEIDRIVSRTIAYGIVTAILAVAFGSIIVVLSTALSTFAQGQAIAVAASTLAAFAIFQPLLRRVRRNVDRRFDRARYDAEQTVAKFSERLRDDIDLGDLSSDLDAAIRDAISPQSVGIWLRESRR